MEAAAALPSNLDNLSVSNNSKAVLFNLNNENDCVLPNSSQAILENLC